jgi:hypothetical protein
MKVPEIIWWQINSKKYLKDGAKMNKKDSATIWGSLNKESLSILKTHRKCSILNLQMLGTNIWLIMNKLRSILFKILRINRFKKLRM